MKIIDKTVLDVHEPENTNVIWAEPVKKGINLHIFNDDKWNTVGGSDEEESSTEKEASTTIPLMDGIPSVGSELKYARGDHRHPSDTSKANKPSGNVVAGHVATLDASGNLVDSGVSVDNIGTDTKNTAGATNDTSKIYVVGAKTQTDNPQTYSRASVYIGTDGKLRSGFGINNATDNDSIVATNKDITYDMSTSGGDTIAIIDKTTGKVKPSGESFDSILQGFIDGINGINANDEGWWFNYAICNTESDNAAKTATLISGSISTVLDNNNLPTYKEGTQIVVKFTNKNTESDPTLNINNVGAKEIHINGWPISGEYNARALNNFVLLEYDGTYWNIVGPTTTDSIVWSGGGTVFDQNNSLSGCLKQLNGDMQTLTGRAIKTVAYDTTTHTITTTKVPTGSTAQNVVTAAQIVADGLNIDSTPTAGSTNPVTSAGIKAYVDNATPTITMDDTPTSGSNNPVKSGGIYTSLQGKQNTLTFDSTPTASSTNPVTSGGVKTALDLKANQSTTYTKTEVDGLLEDVAYLGDDDGQATTLDFDPQADTVWNKAQTLSSAQKQQARENIGAAGINDIAGMQVVNHGTSDTTFALTPNKFHVWGEVASLTLTFATGEVGYIQEYIFQFTSGSTATTLNLPSSVKWITSNTVEANKTYQVSILNSLAVMGGA